jgi:hypothetical protein
MLAPAHWHDIVVEPCRALARVAHSHAAPCPAQPGHQRASQQPLQVEGNIRPNSAEAERPRERSDRTGSSAKFFTGKDHCLVDDRIVREKGLPAFVNQPDDSCLWQKILERGRAGEGMNDVAERAWLDEKERLQVSAETRLRENQRPTARRSAKRLGRPASTMAFCAPARSYSSRRSWTSLLLVS